MPSHLRAARPFGVFKQRGNPTFASQVSVAGSSSTSSNNIARRLLSFITAFLLGCAACTSVFVISQHSAYDETEIIRGLDEVNLRGARIADSTTATSNTIRSSSLSSPLRGLRVLVAIASYDFSQLLHLEEVLDSYRDLCEAGSVVDIYIYTTQPYPVALIDLLSSRLRCINPSSSLSIKIALKSPSLRLNLVDCHRYLFYEKLQEGAAYDLYIYSEDDIRVTPTTVAAYITETKYLAGLLGPTEASNYNVGIVRYEYNYPPDIVIDDKTRHATERTTRVYWEHLNTPIIPNAVDVVKAPTSTTSENAAIKGRYVSMSNHHQGMFLATPTLLHSWKNRRNCDFDVVRQRPGVPDNPHQPLAGTQRVWMSSSMLYDKRHCGVQQVIPLKRFGELAVHHLPNKNYRRVGRKGRIGGNVNSLPIELGDGTEKFVESDASLLSEMKLHVELFKNFLAPLATNSIYDGFIEMIDETDWTMPFNGLADHKTKVQQRMAQFMEYVQRGGVLSDSDIRDEAS